MSRWIEPVEHEISQVHAHRRPTTAPKRRFASGEGRFISSRSFVGVLLSCAAASTVIASPCAAQQLGSYNISPNQIYVAGFSAGGYMAVQMHVAFSHLFKGAAIYAGGPYYCAQDSLATALDTCEQDEPAVDVGALESTTASWASQGVIDPVADLKGEPVYLWSGTQDTLVRQPLMDALKSYYENFQANVFQYDNGFDAQHGWESPYGPVSCSQLETPYVVSCTNYMDGVAATPAATGASLPDLSSATTDLSGATGLTALGQSGAATGGVTAASLTDLSSGATDLSGATGLTALDQSGAATTGATGASLTDLSSGATNPYGTTGTTGTTGLPGFGPYDSEQVWLTQWFGKLNPKNQGTLNGSMISFDQNAFAPGDNAAAISMDQTGYAFVPADCASGAQCGLVLVLHGCEQYHGAVGSAFINDTGINQWADTNHIVVLYPQTIAMNNSNPEGCWDWWGYLSANYAQKSGPQMQALYAMVARVAGASAQP
jgi:poly(3-hydroxybutyrate) depolymerase